MITETREVSDFDQVYLRGYGKLHITQGDIESLTIEADEDLLPKIKTEVSDGKLRLDVDEDWIDGVASIFTRGFERTKIYYKLTVKDISRLVISGAGRVKVEGLETEALTVKLSGAADIALEGLAVERLEVDIPGAGKVSADGKAAQQTVDLSGAGTYRAKKLESRSAKVALSGVGSAAVWVTEALDASVSGLGSVEYYGRPRVRRSVSGLGSVNGLGEA